MREVREECGLRVRIGHRRVRAIDVVHAADERRLYEERSTVVDATVDGPRRPARSRITRPCGCRRGRPPRGWRMPGIAGRWPSGTGVEARARRATKPPRRGGVGVLKFQRPLMRPTALLLLPLLGACVSVRSAVPPAPPAPRVDYHQHLVSAAFAPIVKRPARDGGALRAELDAAGVGKAVVLSVGYSFADERKQLPDPDRLTRDENDWTSAQVAAGGGRLIGFCSANPLRPAALAELARCLGLPGMRGIKLHFGNGGVTLRDSAHAARLVEVFTLAERRRVLVHLRARGGQRFGAEDARLFLDRLVAAAPSIEIVVAHLGGAGPGYPAQADSVMAVFGAAAERDDRRMRDVYFDVATAVTEETSPEEAALVARRIRQVGPRRVLYGSDLSPPGGSVRSGWEIFRDRVPLTADEVRTIAGNVTRFAR